MRMFGKNYKNRHSVWRFFPSCLR